MYALLDIFHVEKMQILFEVRLDSKNQRTLRHSLVCKLWQNRLPKM